MRVLDIALERIYITKNIRTETDEELGELIGSTTRFTQLQPIGVFARGGGRYELVFGHRRFRAAKMNGESTIAAHVLEISERDIPLIKLQENMVRKQLTTEEILAAASELQQRNPELTDRALDAMLGKRSGYLSYHRGITRTRAWLEEAGLKKEYLAAMSDAELTDLKHQLQKKQAQARRCTYHRGDRVPRKGFRLVIPQGPNIIVVCANPEEKRRLIRCLKQLDGPPGRGRKEVAGK